MATQTTVATDKGRNKVFGFLVGKLDGKVMREFVRDNELEIATDVTHEQLAVALVMHFKSTTKAEDLVECTLCKGVSSADLDNCPFCGDDADVEDGDGVIGVANDDAVVQEPEDTNDEEVAVSAVEVVEPSESLIEVLDEEEDEDLEETVPVVAAAPSAKKKSAAKKSAAPKETDTMQTQTNGAGKSKAITKAGSVGLVSTKELDKAIHEVDSLRRDGAGSFWLLGKKIVEINEKGLWKLRLDEGGKSRYKSFEQFIALELKMSHTSAYNAMDCALKYESIDEIREIGSTTKAAMLLKAADKDRPRLTEMAKNGATRKTIEVEVAKSRAANGSPKAGKQQSRAGAKGGASKAKASAKMAEKVSITSIVGSKTIKLFKRPESMKGFDPATLTRAKKLTDKPVGRYEMANGLVQYFYLLPNEETGELTLKIDTRREEV